MGTTKPLMYRGKEVDANIGFSKSTRFAMQDPKSPQYDPTWPLPIKLSARTTGYLVSEIEAWLASRPRTRIVAGDVRSAMEQSTSRPRTHVVAREEEL